VRKPLEGPDPTVFDELRHGSGDQAVSTTMAFTRLLRNLMRDDDLGRRVVPIIPDEARTFGMDALFREFEIYAAHGQQYEPVDHDLLLSYSEDTDGQILEEGITEAGSLASWTAAGTAWAHRGVPMVPFFIFYSMFGFQRVGDLIWAAADAGARGFLVGATAGRTTLAGEGLQHQDGHSHVLASTVPTCRAFDPAFAYELNAIIAHDLRRMVDGSDGFTYLTSYNENLLQPRQPDGVGDDDIVDGLYRFTSAPDGDGPLATIVFSGSAASAALDAASALADHGVRVDLWSAPGWKQLREEALTVERWNRLHPGDEPKVPMVTRLLAGDGPIIAVTDSMKSVPDQIARWIPVGRRFTPLGTDGFGRSDTREALRRFFETDAAHVEVAVLSALLADGALDASVVRHAIERHGIDPDAPDPRTL
jgi:pyruvate dehydrogenase E1 component